MARLLPGDKYHLGLSTIKIIIKKSSNQILHHMTMHIGQAEATTLMLNVFNAHQRISLFNCQNKNPGVSPRDFIKRLISYCLTNCLRIVPASVLTSKIYTPGLKWLIS